MKVKELTLVSFLASIQYIVFVSFSYILYVEFITFTTVLFAMHFPKRDCVLASFLFTICYGLFQGFHMFNIMYIIIYPMYSYIIAKSQDYLNRHKKMLYGLCGFLSFLCGQIVQLPILITTKVHFSFLLLGFKTSMIQFFLSYFTCKICYSPLEKVLKHQRSRYL